MELELIIQMPDDIVGPAPYIVGKYMFFRYADPTMGKPKCCRECGKLLAGESVVVYLKSGGYCEKCYSYWYEYKNKRYTPDQAFYRDTGWFPYAIFPFGEIEFRKPSPKKIKAQGKMWHHHPDDWDKTTRSMLKSDQILLDGVNWFPENKTKVEIIE